MKYTQKAIDAVNARLAEYEKAVASYTRPVVMPTCRVCEATPPGCGECPISDCGVEGPLKPPYCLEHDLKYLKARLAFLLERLDDNGVERK